MVLDPLVQLIGELAAKIDRHRQALGQSEALTRYAVINPFLDALGWHLEDPDEVHPEYPVPGTQERVDYALLENNQPKVHVEAKKLGSPLAGALAQDMGYCIQTGAPYLVNTDGQRWEIYDIYKQGPIEDKRVVSFDIADAHRVRTAVKALFLWRGNYQQVVVPAPTVTAAVPAPAPTQPNPLPLPKPASAPTPTPVSKSSLAAFFPKDGDQSPQSIVASDGSVIPCRSHINLLVGVVAWLEKNNKLTPKQCPVSIPHARKRFVVDTQAIHPSGKRFFNPVQRGQFWIETNQSVPDAANGARVVLRACNEDPAKWLVQLPSP